MMQQVDVATEIYVSPVVGVTIHSRSSALCSKLLIFPLSINTLCTSSPK